MKKTGFYWLFGGGLIIVLAFLYFGVRPDQKTEAANPNMQKSAQKTEIQATKPAEKIQVYLFHSTNRCYSCVTMGQYVKATVEEFFQPELRDGKVEFKEINIDLPENKELAAKYQAAGTSLFINAIIDGNDNIQEESQAWRLLGNQKTFSDYFSKKIRSLIGEKVSIESQEEMEKMKITFYSGDDCSTCNTIQKYLADHSVKDLVAFEEKNVSANEADFEQMAEDAMQCDVDLESFGVPLLWAEGKCYTNENEIVDFFKQKINT